MPYLHSPQRWLEATRHLTAQQEAAYWRLVTWSAINGELLPLDVDECCRIARAKLLGERKAVSDVLSEFYTDTRHGYVQKTRHQHQGVSVDDPEVRAGMDLTNRRKQRSRTRAITMVRALEAKGITVSHRLSNGELVALCHAHGVETTESWRECMKPQEGIPSVTVDVTPKCVTVDVTPEPARVTVDVTVVTPDVTPRARGEGYLYSLNTNTEIQNTEIQLAALAARTPAPLGARVTPAGEAGMAMKAAGLQGLNLSHPRLLALLDAGASAMELGLAAAEAVAKGKGFTYALAMVEGRRRDAAAAGPLPGPVRSQRDIDAADRLAQWTGGILGARKP